jgi:hypothetical protein
MITEDGLYKRVVTQRGSDDHAFYVACGLHEELVSAGMVLDFQEEPVPVEQRDWARLLVPEQLAFVSYPWEWSFDELKDAALLTLELQKRALAYGLSLKDASAYNVQFRGAKPVFIDTLSFERNAGGPWIAYEQFCRQFLAPLLMMSYVSPTTNRYLRVDLDGFSLPEVSRLLPVRTWVRSGPLLHVHLHARAAGRSAGPPSGTDSHAADPKLHLVDSLRNSVERLPAPTWLSAWTNYYEETRFYTAEAAESKQAAVRELTSELRPAMAFDLGANTGLLAQLLAADGVTCIAFDRDAGCINRLYVEERRRPNSRILPLVMDLANPSPALGFGLNATLSLFDRPPADLVLCLALIHHLHFTERLPLLRIASFLARLGRWLVIEFVPREDPAADILRHGRDDFEDYTPALFLESFGEHYHLRKQKPVASSMRILYLFERRA